MAKMDPWSICNESLKRVDSITSNILSYNIDRAYMQIIDYYKFIKQAIPFFYHEDGTLNFYYDIMLEKLQDCQEMLPVEYLMDFEAHNFNKVHKIPDSLSDHEAILNYLVDDTRRFLYDELRTSRQFEYCDLTGECYKASKHLKETATEIGVKALVIYIPPAYRPDSKIFGEGGKHWCNFVILNGTPYLVDCTYSQFFLTKRCLIERFGIIGLPGPLPGLFMDMDVERTKVARKILNDGWIELTPSVFKHYFDGFTISFRNGLYYEETKDFSYTTPYFMNDYMEFLMHQDDQINHENKEHLGYQLRPLKNPNMSFNKR